MGELDKKGIQISRSREGIRGCREGVTEGV